jgi:hypothetical protein
VHFAFTSPDRRTVDAFHEAAIAAGGRDNGPPGVRTAYHENYYAAFVMDPEGMSMVDLTTGEETTRITPENPAIYVYDGDLPDTYDGKLDALAHLPALTRPLLTELDGTQVVITSFPVQLTDGPGVELVAVAAECSHTPVPGGCGPINPGNCASHCSGVKRPST